MKAAFTFAILATPAAAVPAQRIQSLDLGKRLDGPATVPLTFVAENNGGDDVLDRQKQSLAAKYPQLFDKDDLAEMRKRSQGNLKVTYPSSDTFWTAPMSLGTPPQVLPLLIDTGSPQTWAFSPKCKGCGTGFFDPSKSSTFVNLTTPAKDVYDDDKLWVTGWQVKDTAGIGSVVTKAVNFTIVDAQQNMKLEQTAAGISGWSYLGGRDSTPQRNPETPIPRIQAVDNKQWSEPTFGLFLNRRNARAAAAGTQSKGDGALTIGGVDQTYFTGSLEWIPWKDVGMILWTLDFVSIVINGQRITLPKTDSSMAIMDTGTTLIYGPLSLVRQYYSHVPGATENKDGTWTVDCKRMDIKASFNFGGQDWPIDPTDTVYEVSPGKCIGAVRYLENMVGEDSWLVGGAFLKNVYTAWRYDPPAIGFGKLKAGI